MKIVTAIASVLLALGMLGGAAQAAGPSSGNGPWIACPNNNVTCEAQLGPDLDPSNEVFDCQTKNGSLGHALQNSNSGNVHCWAN